MKKYDFKIQKFSKNADKKLKRKLYFMSLKKNFTNFFHTQNFKLILPVFAFAILVFSFFNYWNIREDQKVNLWKTEQLTENTKNYENIAKSRVLKAKIEYYKKYSNMRKAKSFTIKK